jgi:hypothetical protein
VTVRIPDERSACETHTDFVHYYIVSYVRFLEWIRSERLTTLPHKGSRWDKVLIRALYFAEQLHNFEQAVQSFAHDSNSAAIIGYGHAQLLLEVCQHIKSHSGSHIPQLN